MNSEAAVSERPCKWVCDPVTRNPDDIFIGMWDRSPLVAVCGMTLRPASDDGSRPFNVTVFVDEDYPMFKDDSEYALGRIRAEVNKVILNVTGYPLDDDKIEVRPVSRT